MDAVTSFMLLFSVLVPTKGWYQPNEAINVTVKPPAGVEVKLRVIEMGRSWSGALSRDMPANVTGYLLLVTCQVLNVSC